MDVDMDTGVKGQSHTVDLFKELYEKLTPIIWVIKIEGKMKKKSYVSYYTGFTVRSVSKDGHVMTCAHGRWEAWSGRTIKARRLGRTSDFEFDVEVVTTKTRWDMCLMKVEVLNLKDNECGKLACGKVDGGENVIVIGHPKEFVGSCIIGHAAYPCTDKVESDYDNLQTCYKFISEALTHTPLYRVMGHIWHSEYFIDAEEKDRKIGVKVDRTYEKNLQPQLPIIQCSGFVSGVGTSGAPIFNVKGEIVGMLILEADGYQIGVHVTALRTFLEQNLPSNEDSGLRREIEEVPLEGVSESSKSMTKKSKTSSQ